MGAAADMCPYSSLPSISVPVFDDTNCPSTSRIGTLSLTTPLMPTPLVGHIHLVHKSPVPALGLSIHQDGVGINGGGAYATPQIDQNCDSEVDYCYQQMAFNLLSLPEMPVTELQLSFGAAERTSVNGNALSQEMFQIDGSGGSQCISPSNMQAIATPYSGASPVTLNDDVGIDGCGGVNLPQTSLGSSPADPTNDPSPVFAFSSSDSNATFQCKLDNTSYASCTSPYSPSAGLADGGHTFRVRSVNESGPDSSPIAYQFVVDTTPPVEPTLVSTPPSPSSSTSSIVSFEGENGGYFECQLDSDDFETCSSPKTYVELDEGYHTFGVRQVDESGNVGELSAADWEIDTTPPNIALTKTPDDAATDGTPTLEFSSDDPNAMFECKIDQGEMQACTSPFTTEPLDLGSHSFEMTATDEAGNVSSTSTFFTIERPTPEDDAGSGVYGLVSIALGPVSAAQINVATGNLLLNSRDLSPSEASSNVGYDRYYNSLAAGDFAGSLGPRWSLSVGPDVYLISTSDSVEVHGPGGYVVWLSENSDGTFDGPADFQATLTRNSDGTFTLNRWQESDSLTFDSSGRPINTISANGDTLAVTRVTTNGRTRLASYGVPSNGPAIVSQADSEGRIEQVSGSQGMDSSIEPVTYTYDSEGRMDSSSVEAGTATYGYDYDGFLDSVTTPDGTVASIVNNEDGQVQEITVTRPSEDPETTAFDYRNGETEVTRPDGSEHLYAYDVEGQPLEDPELHDLSAEEYADYNDVSASEAESAMVIQERSAGLADDLDQALGSDYAGAWYDPPDEGRIKVNLSPNASLTTAESVVEGHNLDDETDYVSVSYTQQQLDDAGDSIAESLAGLIEEGLAQVSIDIAGNRVVIETTNNLDSIQTEEVEDLAAEAPVQVSVLATSSSTLIHEELSCRRAKLADHIPAACTRPIRGGTSIAYSVERPLEQCTAGFLGYVGYLANHQYKMLTAGHCVDGSLSQYWGAAYPRSGGASEYLRLGHASPFYENGVQHPGPNGQKGDSGAIEVSTSGSWYPTTPKPWILTSKQRKYGFPVSDRYTISGVGSTASKQGALKNKWVCASGSISGTHCGPITGRSLSTEVDSGATYKNQISAKLCGLRKGDSGGSVVSSHLAFGILSTAVIGSCEATYTVASEAQTVTGVTILTTSPRSKAATVLAEAPDVSDRPPSSESNGEPTFFATPNGLETSQVLEYGSGLTGVVKFTRSVLIGGIGHGSTAVQIPPEIYSLCVSNESTYARVRATNPAGSAVSQWILLPVNCTTN